jgi:folate-binding protein YgfZ
MSLAWYRFNEPVVFKVSGKDSRRYLNNRLSHDLRAREQGDSLLAGALTPQGRVEALFTVYVESDDEFYLVCDGGERQPLFAALGRYIVADRVSIIDCSSEAVVAHITAAPRDIDTSGLSAKCFLAPRSRIDSSGSDLLALCSDRAVIEAALCERMGISLNRAEYDLRRFAQNCPVFPEEVNAQVVLTEVGLREAVSFTKGCYVGQEVIERSDAIGKLPRRLERIIFEGLAAATASAGVVTAENKPIGKLLSVFQDRVRNQTKAFALLKTGLYAPQESVECEGMRGRILSVDERDV